MALDIMDIDTISTFLSEHGLGQGLLIILCLGIMYFLYCQFDKIYKAVLEGKDTEIKRLVEENKSYRLMFETLIREKLDLPKIIDSTESENLVLKETPKIKNK